ncbi:MAG: DNA gyrase inhibitor YacG [Beijerinckiaceae bacterium]|nr:DNA gyrase inhibitor YacG [Beijerinckiaceae bacterium]
MPETKSETPFADQAAATPPTPCPVCGKPAAFEARPFCSKRCADIDLHRWLYGVYAIPGPEAADVEAETVKQDAAKS